jgi:hypothetical protein
MAKFIVAEHYMIMALLLIKFRCIQAQAELSELSLAPIANLFSGDALFSPFFGSFFASEAISPQEASSALETTAWSAHDEHPLVTVPCNIGRSTTSSGQPATDVPTTRSARLTEKGQRGACRGAAEVTESA